MAITPEMILQVRYELGDLSIELPILANEEYSYFLQKNNESIRRASLDAAKTILLKLSMSSGRKTIDILSIDNSRTASSYKEALLMFLRNPDINGSLGNLLPYAGGVSLQDMQNNYTSDNNFVKSPKANRDDLINNLVF